MAITCPHCGAFAPFDQRSVWDAPLRADVPEATFVTPNGTHIRVGAWKCSNCEFPVAGLIGQNDRGEPALWWPRKGEAPQPLPHVPRGVEDSRQEAYLSRSVGAVRASVTMTRRAVQAAAFELGAPDEGMLFGQIDWLAANGKLTPDLRDLAHELRVFGKEGAHPAHDGLSDVTEEDADAALDFLEHFLNYVFVLPGGVAARRAERQKGA